MQSARSRLLAMHEVIKPLMGQIVHWISTGKVAANKIVHVGIPQARAIVRNKSGKKTEFGLAYLISRLGGGYLFGKRIAANADERQMPLKALAGYRAIFGQKATPELVVYDRGGDSTPTRQRLALEGVKDVGIQPKGKRPWSVAEGVREQIRSERGRTEGVHRDVEKQPVQIQQAQRTSLANAGDGGAEVYLVVQSEQIHAGFGGADPVRDRQQDDRNEARIEEGYRGNRKEWRPG